MPGETFLTMPGTLYDQPMEKRIGSGTACCNFRIISTERRFDRQSKHYIDGDSLILRVTCWRGLAENVISSLSKGMRVQVTGRLAQKTFTDHEGREHSQIEMTATEVATCLSWSPVVVQHGKKPGTLQISQTEDGFAREQQ